ncbi:hypothetical protein JXA85_01635 [Candidatus Woesearchaeota archaeon]|nr:hypothetical protein [Candidatus Woesearchaeota archaeon]
MVMVVRYGELALKGKNRALFERKLVENIVDCMKRNNVSYESIERPRGRILINVRQNVKELEYVFGITSFSQAIRTPAKVQDIEEGILSLVKSRNFNSFRISARRLTKSTAEGSPELNRILGAFVVGKTGKKVRLENPDIDIGIEIMNQYAYIFTERAEGAGGLPLGVEGRVVCLIRNDADVLAAFLMMKRGCFITPVGFSDFDLSLLEKYSYGQGIRLIMIKNIKQIDEVAAGKKAKAIVTGDTLESFNRMNAKHMVLMPLIAFSDEMIEEELRCLRT